MHHPPRAPLPLPLLALPIPPRLTRRINLDRPPTILIRLTNTHLHTHPHTLLQHQRSNQRQILNPTSPHTRRRRQRQLHKPTPRQQHHPTNHMISKPRLQHQRQTPRQQPPLSTRNTHHSTQQRMPTRQLSNPHRIRPNPRIKPKPPPLKRIRRKPNTPHTTLVEQRPPINLHTITMRRRQEPQQRLALTAPRATQRTREHTPTLNRRRTRRQRRQNRIRPDLQKTRHPSPREKLHTIREAHRLTHMPHPIPRRTRLLSRQHPTTDIRHDRDLRRPQRHTLSHRLQPPEHRLHQMRMKRMTNIQTPRPAPPP